MIVAALAQEIITLDQELAELAALVSEKVTEYRDAQTLLSMPGFGPVLAAEFLDATGGDLTVFGLLTGLQGSPDWPRCPGTPATTTSPGATTGACCAPDPPRAANLIGDHRRSYVPAPLA